VSEIRPAVAVLIPCYNEAVAISAVVSAFQQQFFGASIYVYDNNSTDDTAGIAARSGAIVRREPRQGKGHVVRRMFADVEADVYVLVDGDDTYDAACAPVMLEELLEQRQDMVNGRRISEVTQAYRFGHRLGNRVLSAIVAWIFGRQFDDILSGFRVFSRRYVKSFPALSTGFEIETELTIHALSLNMPVGEVPVSYKERPAQSNSKLHTVRDGIRILVTILKLTKEERPLYFFSVICVLVAALSVGLSIPVILEWIETGLVPRFPTAILSTGLMLLAFMSLTNGFVLSSLARAKRELKRLHYLNLPWLGTGSLPAGPIP
jgi:glycosyltransferase involved in cell wall biosynthesis